MFHKMFNKDIINYKIMIKQLFHNYFTNYKIIIYIDEHLKTHYIFPLNVLQVMCPVWIKDKY